MADTLSSTAQVSVHDQSIFLDKVKNELRAFEYNFAHPSENRVELSTAFGQATFTAQKNVVTIEISAANLTQLIDLKSTIAFHFANILPDPPEICWEGYQANDNQLPNFRLGTVISCEPVGTIFWRLVIAGDDLKRFAEKGLHFRLVRQTDMTRAPIWPYLNEFGVPKWPAGEDELVEKVYTTRAIDIQKGELTLDIFRHDGGVTSDWAATRPVGQTVGLMGPGGGWFPRADWISLAGDETAVPAILRIIENMSVDQKGDATILTQNPNEIQEIIVPKHFTLNWIFRDDNASFVEIAKKQFRDAPTGAFHWFASQQNEARAIRQFLREELNLDKSHAMSVAYWK